MKDIIANMLPMVGKITLTVFLYALLILIDYLKITDSTLVTSIYGAIGAIWVGHAVDNYQKVPPPQTIENQGVTTSRSQTG